MPLNAEEIARYVTGADESQKAELLSALRTARENQDNPDKPVKPEAAKRGVKRSRKGVEGDRKAAQEAVKAKESSREASKESEPRRKRFGTKKEVFNGEADSTRGGLTKSDLVLNARGIPVSKRASEAAKARAPGFGKNK